MFYSVASFSTMSCADGLAGPRSGAGALGQIRTKLSRLVLRSKTVRACGCICPAHYPMRACLHGCQSVAASHPALVIVSEIRTGHTTDRPRCLWAVEGACIARNSRDLRLLGSTRFRWPDVEAHQSRFLDRNTARDSW